MNEPEQILLMFKGMISDLSQEKQNSFKNLESLLISEMRERLTTDNEEMKLIALAAYMSLLTAILREITE
jgi:hypothetical protein